ncbi:uncharacterized protein LOC134540146 [Bacillus rossius redtenbacheri]|uniref:uncharacterized protein LOC134540146 n=1 Tax=Bacillus rossius redtenbacheri TaxID=93214 RepID=UPI002FDCEBCD
MAVTKERASSILGSSNDSGLTIQSAAISSLESTGSSMQPLIITAVVALLLGVASASDKDAKQDFYTDYDGYMPPPPTPPPLPPRRRNICSWKTIPNDMHNYYCCYSPANMLARSAFVAVTCSWKRLPDDPLDYYCCTLYPSHPGADELAPDPIGMPPYNQLWRRRRRH